LQIFFRQLLVPGGFLPKRQSRHDAAFRQRLTFEPLEARQMLAVFTVMNLNDAAVTAADQAPGTLRQAIFDANALPGADVVQFAANLSGSVQLSVVGDTVEGSSAFVVSSAITIRGNSNGITLQRGLLAPDMRMFRVTSAGNLTLESITITGGVARGANGAAPGIAGETVRGGAILNQGTLEVIASTLYDNTAIGGNASGAIGGKGLGGGIANEGGALTLKNATLSGNSVVSGTGNRNTASFGGAIHGLNGLVKIYNSTITNNSAAAGRQVYLLATFGTATLEMFSSIIAQQDAPPTFRDVVVVQDTDGELIISAANNIIRTEVGLDDIGSINADPLLAPLADNGGPTLTHAIPAASPAINAGSNPLNLTNDQRGSTFARTIGAEVDIGAFELQSAPALPGDYNRDDMVDAADYVMWRKTMGSGIPTFNGADGDGSGSIDAGDYLVWTKNFGAELLAGSGGMQSSLSPALPIVVAAAKSNLMLQYDFSAYRSNDEDAKQREIPPSTLDMRPIMNNTHDKALLAVLLGWDAERGERVSISFE
jgi:hypothetical protein